MELCQHVECMKKRKQWTQRVKNVEYWEQELRRLHANEYRIKWSAHVEQRESERNVRSWQSQEIFENGSCISFAIYNDTQFGQTYEWIWFWYLKVGRGLYRPIHMVLKMNPGVPVQKIVVSTIYDPSIKPWMWDENYSTRICWKEK